MIHGHMDRFDNAVGWIGVSCENLYFQDLASLFLEKNEVRKCSPHINSDSIRRHQIPFLSRQKVEWSYMPQKEYSILYLESSANNYFDFPQPSFPAAARSFFLINEDPGNLPRELRNLEEERLYTSFAKGRLRFYSLNNNYPLFKELKR